MGAKNAIVSAIQRIQTPVIRANLPTFSLPTFTASVLEGTNRGGKTGGTYGYAISNNATIPIIDNLLLQ
jgi:hypothetical protein